MPKIDKKETTEQAIVRLGKKCRVKFKERVNEFKPLAQFFIATLDLKRNVTRVSTTYEDALWFTYERCRNDRAIWKVTEGESPEQIVAGLAGKVRTIGRPTAPKFKFTSPHVYNEMPDN